MEDTQHLELTQAQYTEKTRYLQTLKNDLALAQEKLIEAKKQGDLRENSEYEAASKEIEMLNVEIKKTEISLRNAKIIQASSSGTVGPHSRVEVVNVDTGEQFNLQLVSTPGKPPHDVSINSLFAHYAMEKHVGDIIEYVDVLFRHQRFKILKIG